MVSSTLSPEISSSFNIDKIPWIAAPLATTSSGLTWSISGTEEKPAIIARIIGTVVASQKDERLEGKKLLIVRPVNLDGTDTSGYVVAVDTVGAGFHERVLVVAGSRGKTVCHW